MGENGMDCANLPAASGAVCLIASCTGCPLGTSGTFVSFWEYVPATRCGFMRPCLASGMWKADLPQ